MAELEITRNERVMALDGSEMGRVVHVVVDSGTKQLTDLVVEHDNQEFLVPVSNVERASNGAITLRATASQMSNAAMFSRDMYHEVDEDAFDATMPTRATAGTATVRDADEDSVIIDSTPATAAKKTAAPAPRPAPAVRTEQTTTRTEQTTARPAATTRGDETISVPVIEEQLKAGVREREAGVFRLTKRVTQEQQSIDVPLRREEVYITETNTAARPATQADLDAMGRDIEVPLRQQEAVTSKEAVVTGEVDVRKQSVTETQRVTDTVRREEVHVEGANTSRVHTQGFSTDQQARHDAMSPNLRTRYASLNETQRTEYDRRYPIRRDNSGNILDPDGDGENAFEELGKNITQGTNRPGNR